MLMLLIMLNKPRQFHQIVQIHYASDKDNIYKQDSEKLAKRQKCED